MLFPNVRSERVKLDFKFDDNALGRQKYACMDITRCLCARFFKTVFLNWVGLSHFPKSLTFYAITSWHTRFITSPYPKFAVSQSEALAAVLYPTISSHTPEMAGFCRSYLRERIFHIRFEERKIGRFMIFLEEFSAVLKKALFLNNFFWGQPCENSEA